MSVLFLWLTGKTSRSYRLPSEAQWEYTARGGGRIERYAGNPAYAWNVYFPCGSSDGNSKSYKFFVRLVNGGGAAMISIRAGFGTTVKAFT